MSEPRTVEAVRWDDKNLHLSLDVVRHPTEAGVWIVLLDVITDSDICPQATVRCGVITDCPTAQDATTKVSAMLENQARFVWLPSDRSPSTRARDTEGIVCTRADLERAYIDGLTYYENGAPKFKVFPIGAPSEAPRGDSEDYDVEFGCSKEERELLAENVRRGVRLGKLQDAVGRPFNLAALRELSTRSQDGSWSPVRFAQLSSTATNPTTLRSIWRTMMTLCCATPRLRPLETPSNTGHCGFRLRWRRRQTAMTNARSKARCAAWKASFATGWRLRTSRRVESFCTSRAAPSCTMETSRWTVCR